LANLYDDNGNDSVNMTINKNDCNNGGNDDNDDNDDGNNN